MVICSAMISAQEDTAELNYDNAELEYVQFRLRKRLLSLNIRTESF